MSLEFSPALGARPVGKGKLVPVEAISQLVGAALPAAYAALLQKHGGHGISFENGACFPSRCPSAWAVDGMDGVDFLYGLRDDKFGLARAWRDNHDRLPNTVLAIGESCGGANIICLEIASGHVLYWDHEADSEDAEFSLMAESIQEFIAGLVPEPKRDTDDDGVVSSRLDF